MEQKERTADRTRRRLMETAFVEIHREGFQGLRINTVLDKAGLTKGAIYHYFPSKQALGYAVVDEIIADHIKDVWLDTLARESDPAAAIRQALKKATESRDLDIGRYGCPLNNLAQEMSPIDEGFRMRTSRLFKQWRDAIAGAVERGKTSGSIRPDVDSMSVATYLLASIEGCIGLAKSQGDADVIAQCTEQIEHYLGTLRKAEPCG